MVQPLSKDDPRALLWAWLDERSGMAMNTVLYTQPLSLTYEQVRALVAFRVCRAHHENRESGQVVHCLKVAGHTYNHAAGYEWEPCTKVATRYTERYPCIRPAHHKGRCDFGGWGENYDDWSGHD